MISRIKDFFILKIISVINTAEKAHKKLLWNIFSSKPEISIHKTWSNLSLQNFKGIGDSFGKITIGEYFNIRDYCSFLVFPGAELKIGNRVFFNNFCSVNCLDYVEIGDDTLFGEGVKIYDHNHLIEKKDTLHYSKDEFTKAAIVIGKNCWIGSNVTILKGVTIGENCIIGAGCLVYKSVPANTIVKNTSALSFESL